MVSKLYEKLLLKILKHSTEKSVIPLHQFRFRDKYATVDRVYRITKLMKTLFVILAVSKDEVQDKEKIRESLLR